MKVWVASVCCMSLAGITAWVLNDLNSNQGFKTLQCIWQENVSASFDVNFEATAEINHAVLNPSAPSRFESSKLRFSGVFDVKAAANEPEFYVGTLRGVLSEKNINSSFSLPFQFKLNSQCRFGDFGFSVDDAEESRNLKRNFLLSLDLLNPTNDQVNQWQGTQSDAMGEYLSSYKYDKEANTFYRNKLFYKRAELSLPGGKETKIQVTKSDTEFLLHEEFWLTSVKSNEAVVVRTHLGNEFIRSRAISSLTRNDERPVVAVQSLPTKWEKTLSQQRKPKLDVQAPQFDDNVEGIPRDFDAAVAELKRGHAGGRLDAQLVHRLIVFLRKNPNAIAQFVAAIKRQEFSDDLQATLFFIFERAGTPEIQKALISILQDGEHREMNRMRAAHAVGETDAPIAEAVDALIYNSREFSTEDSLASTSLLALGILERRQTTKDPETAERVNEELLSQIAQVNISDEQRAVLSEALGNTGNEKNESVLSQQLGSQSASVRRSAARGLARIDTEGGAKILFDALAQEKDVQVRQVLADQLAKFNSRKGITLEELTRSIKQESDVTTRVALVHSLGREIEKNPAAKKVLKDIFASDSSARVKVAVGQHLKGDEL